ncbi:Telomere length regulation protein elg15 / FY16936)) [Taphrina deformans PYCC 5710]|uniref:Telomere length regulation protein elg15 / FY16936 n=1 Tax=Taphrina deformans (strain PYCC 5710 / ATCC 11124 / CBS 356.35 / IMI 108563 / JCM 9778 / NBRC 8474) TaxID=1097556 RepID=R4X8J6_TAPDE|nr:Telomere length regulation protein elg15 / FY16936)) [Taphrina deformans PYCC 5710]|eukprot:CCG81660.1 Telomere length regulation protein elg15 / FY16936)) [Taphrina deformans PYCC 5710]
MGRKRIAQKNTLALWAGAKSEEQLNSTILHFKVNVERLKKCQAHRTLSHNSVLTSDDKSFGSLLGDGSVKSESSKTSTIDSASEHGDAKAVVTSHPFFSRPKKSNETPSTREPNDSISKEPGGPKAETHSFFKPRTNTKEGSCTQSSTHRPSKAHPWPTPMPTKETMQVTGSLTTFKDSKAGSEFLLRNRKRSSIRVNSSDADCSDATWSSLTKFCIGSVPSGPLTNSTETVPNSPIPEYKFERYHGALRGLANRRNSAVSTEADKVLLWNAKYAPQCAAEVLQEGSEAMILRDWLKTRRLHMRDRLEFATKKHVLPIDKYIQEHDDFIVDDEAVQPATSDIGAEFDQDHEITPCPTGRESLWKSNLVILCGPTGCGKSAALQAVAEELHYEIFEVNSTDRRSGKDVLEKVGEASQSQMVNKQKSADGSQSKSLLLFEEVDVLYRDDKDFWTAVLSLISSSKRPVVLTCNDHLAIPTQLAMPSIFLDFKVPHQPLILDYLSGIVALEQATITRLEILNTITYAKRDLRASINSLQYLSLASGSLPETDGEIVAQELMSQQMLVTALYEPSVPRDSSKRSLPRKVFSEYEAFTSGVSYIDLYANQQRSLALEEGEVFENDTEEHQARDVNKDDLFGQWIIAEPFGRFTRLHPGDPGLPAEMAFALQDYLPQDVCAQYPHWTLCRDALYRDSIHTKAKAKEDKTWTMMMENFDSFAVPDNWMHDFAPHNCIDRARLSGILASDVAPYLRTMASTEEERSATEQAALAAHTGRTTRNTISNEFGMAWRRPFKMDEGTRRDVLLTRLDM